VVNRDLSVACLKQFVKARREEVASGRLKPRANKNGAPRCLDPEVAAERRASDPEQIRILEGLAASGLRAIRYALEVLRFLLSFPLHLPLKGVGCNPRVSRKHVRNSWQLDEGESASWRGRRPPSCRASDTPSRCLDIRSLSPLFLLAWSTTMLGGGTVDGKTDSVEIPLPA